VPNERKTENIVREFLRKKNYFKAASGLTVEEQKSDYKRVQKLLETASKRGSGAGRPEFIICSSQFSEFIIIIECKASTQQHVSQTLDRYADFAVDGALLYASFLSKDFDVLAIAVSGETTPDLRISHFLHLKGEPKAVEFKEAASILSFDEYHNAFLQSDVKFRQDYDTLLDYSRSLNEALHEKKIKEAHRGLLISGILIALKNNAFKTSFKAHKTAKELGGSLVNTIESEFESAGIPADRKADLKQAFSFIRTVPALRRDKPFFISLIEGISENVDAFMRTHRYYDTIGQFYIEFLRYANNDKGLGIVLTPPHIAELFSGLADVNKNTIAFDNCCGTSGLLIAAMKVMVRDAKSNETQIKRIKSKQIFGIEYQDDIYTLAVSNMILHGDGKTNIHCGDCFAEAKSFIRSRKPTVGLLNPPYKGKNENDRDELEFVLNNLSVLAQGGKCIAIVPITCATAPSKWKTLLFEKHTLEAVMSMPIELFHNSKVGVVTCIMVFTAHRPHPKGKKTWFGYWRDDGFEKTKHRGRIDVRGAWESTKTKWINAYGNRETIKGFSVTKEVGSADEWCAEAYLKTDYGVINQHYLVSNLKRYYLFNVMALDATRDEVANEDVLSPVTSKPASRGRIKTGHSEAGIS